MTCSVMFENNYIWKKKDTNLAFVVFKNKMVQRGKLFYYTYKTPFWIINLIIINNNS